MARIFAVNMQYGSGQGFTIDDVRAIKALGFNTVRLRVYWKFLQPINENTIDERVFTTSVGPPNTAGLDSYVNMCEQEGLNIILHMAVTPTYPNPTWAFNGAPEVGYNEFEKLITPGSREGIGVINCWKSVANRYHNKPFLWLELWNEPGINDPASQYPVLYKDFMEKLIDEIASVESVNHLKIVPLLRAGDAWEEVVDQQPDILRPNVAWATHRYERYGDYNPDARDYCYDYDTKTWGWFTTKKFIYWRIRRCSDKIQSWGKQEINTEFGKETTRLRWDEWLNYVLATSTKLGIEGWTYHDYNRSDNGEGFSIVDANRNTVTPILNVLVPYMTTLTPVTHTLNIRASISGLAATIDGKSITIPTSLTLEEGIHVIEVPASATVGNFIQWEDGSVNPKRQIYLTSDMNIFAEYTQSPITLTVTTDGNGAVVPAGTFSLIVGSSYQFQTTPKTGFSFDHWDLSGASLGSSNPLTITAIESMDNKILKAIFTTIPPAQISISLTVIGSGKTNPAEGPHVFNVGDTITFTAIPTAGQTFNGWKLDGQVYTDNPLELTITSDMNSKTLTAEFTGPTTPTVTPIFPRVRNVLSPIAAFDTIYKRVDQIRSGK